MRDPLLAPLAAIATGILLSRLVPFETRELLIAIVAFAALGAPDHRQRDRSFFAVTRRLVECQRLFEQWDGLVIMRLLDA